jgi:hypothetical protein
MTCLGTEDCEKAEEFYDSIKDDPYLEIVRAVRTRLEQVDRSEGQAHRVFDTGASRDTDENKLDFEGFLSPLVLQRFAEFMHENRHMKDGSTRDSDNWQKGIPLNAYMKSGWRHFMDWWSDHRNHDSSENIEVALCALLFNVQGYLHEILKEGE